MNQLSQKQTAKLRVIEATRAGLRTAQTKLISELQARASAQSSWCLFEELQGFKGLSFKGVDPKGHEETITYDAKEHNRVKAAYDSTIHKLQQEVDIWEQALTEAIENLIR
jgi:hypothetical protein